jgi:hypothetical protein
LGCRILENVPIFFETISKFMIWGINQEPQFGWDKEKEAEICG